MPVDHERGWWCRPRLPRAEQGSQLIHKELMHQHIWLQNNTLGLTSEEPVAGRDGWDNDAVLTVRGNEPIDGPRAIDCCVRKDLGPHRTGPIGSSGSNIDLDYLGKAYQYQGN